MNRIRAWGCFSREAMRQCPLLAQKITVSGTAPSKGHLKQRYNRPFDYITIISIVLISMIAPFPLEWPYYYVERRKNDNSKLAKNGT